MKNSISVILEHNEDRILLLGRGNLEDIERIVNKIAYVSTTPTMFVQNFLNYEKCLRMECGADVPTHKKWDPLNNASPVSFEIVFNEKIKVSTIFICKYSKSNKITVNKFNIEETSSVAKSVAIAIISAYLLKIEENSIAYSDIAGGAYGAVTCSINNQSTTLDLWDNGIAVALAYTDKATPFENSFDEYDEEWYQKNRSTIIFWLEDLIDILRREV